MFFGSKKNSIHLNNGCIVGLFSYICIEAGLQFTLKRVTERFFLFCFVLIEHNLYINYIHKQEKMKIQILKR